MKTCTTGPGGLPAGIQYKWFGGVAMVHVGGGDGVRGGPAIQGFVTKPVRLRAPWKSHLRRGPYLVPPTSISKSHCSVFEWQPVGQLPSFIRLDDAWVAWGAGKPGGSLKSDMTEFQKCRPPLDPHSPARLPLRDSRALLRQRHPADVGSRSCLAQLVGTQVCWSRTWI